MIHASIKKIHDPCSSKKYITNHKIIYIEKIIRLRDTCVCYCAQFHCHRRFHPRFIIANGTIIQSSPMNPRGSPDGVIAIGFWSSWTPSSTRLRSKSSRIMAAIDRISTCRCHGPATLVSQFSAGNRPQSDRQSVVVWLDTIFGRTKADCCSNCD